MNAKSLCKLRIPLLDKAAYVLNKKNKLNFLIND